MSAPYELRPLDLSDAGLAPVTDLLRTVFPEAGHFTPEVLRWQYVHNPDGAAVGFNAWAGGTLAAHYVTIPLRAVVHGVEEPGLLSLNTATHPQHQGKGLFTRLAEATYAAGAAQGRGFVVGVANANSTPGFTRKLGFQLVAPLDARIGAGPLPWRADAPAPRFAPVHDARKLAWRLAHPAYRYGRAVQRDHTVLLSARRMKGFRFVLGVEPGSPEAGGLPRVAPPLLKAFIGLDPAMRWSGSTYWNVPMKFRPAPLNLIFKDLSGRGRQLEAGAVRFHATDFDVL
ncbi:MAG TPA: GNAT family N-acetyltransferase [Flavobacteriales bacterium]|nr:GNAT family N-acetyltransferase [Flavobacteriales bacterium]HQW87109.1 GNAT family N-acetyltransferase [Flavobacteriales bacterium]